MNWGTEKLQERGAGPLEGAAASKEGIPDPAAPPPAPASQLLG